MTRQEGRARLLIGEHDRIKRIAQRYDRPPARVIVGAQDAVREVSHAVVNDSYGAPVPDVLDVAAALALVDRARKDAVSDHELAELDLIAAALGAGQSWQWIGEQLGYETVAAARSARSRYKILYARWARFLDDRALVIEVDGQQVTIERMQP